MVLGSFLHDALPLLINLLELIGIVVILIGSLQTFYKYVTSLLNKKKYNLKKELLDSLALGLDFKLGAEIFRTVLVKELSEILILASIIALRAFLSILIRYDKKNEVAEAQMEKQRQLMASIKEDE